MEFKGKMSPKNESVQSIRTDKELNFSVCSLVDRCDPRIDLKSSHTGQEDGPYIMTPVQTLNPLFTSDSVPDLRDDHTTLKHHSLSSKTSIESVMENRRSRRVGHDVRSDVFRSTSFEQSEAEAIDTKACDIGTGQIKEHSNKVCGDMDGHKDNTGFCVVSRHHHGRVKVTKTPSGSATNSSDMVDSKQPSSSKVSDRHTQNVLGSRIKPEHITESISEQPTSMCTVARGLLTTSGLVWVPLCKPCQTASIGDIYMDATYEEAQLCTRQHVRSV